MPKKLMVILMCFSMATILCAKHAGVLVNATPSMPRGLWHTTPLEGDDEIVSLTPPQDALDWGCVRAHQVLIKRVWARAGETVCESGRMLYKTSAPTHVVHTSLLSKRGELVELGWKGCQTLKPGEVFVLGQHPSSCDSRFFGPVPTSSLRARVTPLLIWDDLQEAP
jgi:type IV secretory pathway protease TraF